MSDIIIPCDTVRRLSKLLATAADTDDIHFHCIRLDNGMAVASNRRIMAVEKIADFSGVKYLVCNPAMIAQCETETAFNSTLHITAVEPLKHATAKTSLGYVCAHNVLLWDEGSAEFDRWRDLIKSPLEHPASPMFWNTDTIAQLGKSSPSGVIVFPDKIDTRRPILLRDLYDPNWFGSFMGNCGDRSVAAATLPDWFK